jgi:hypothetical protein
MRGRTPNVLRKMSGITFSPDERPVLGPREHAIVIAARAALIDTIERYAAPGINPRALRVRDVGRAQDPTREPVPE